MNQATITGDLAAIMPMVIATGLLSSLCTIRTPPEVFDDGGAPDPTAIWPVFPGHEDIRCTAPPLLTDDKMTSYERKSVQDIQAKSVLHVLLDGYYGDLQDGHNNGQTYRAEIDGITYEIGNVESDSQKKMTRIYVDLISI